MLSSVRGALHPTQLLEAAPTYRVDLGLGYQLDTLNLKEPWWAHGPYLELGAYPTIFELNHNLFLRWGIRLNMDVLVAKEPAHAALGAGGLFGTELELTGDGSGALASSGGSGFFVGGAHGQWAFALFAGGLIRSFEHTAYYGPSFGLSVRLPFVAGIACCVWSTSSSRQERAESGRKRRSRAPERRRGRNRNTSDGRGRENRNQPPRDYHRPRTD